MASNEKIIKLEKIGVPTNKPQNNETFLPKYSTIDNYMQESLKKINIATKASNSIPCDRKEDWDYYSTFKAFRQVMKVQGGSIQQQMITLLKYNGIKVANPGDNIVDNLEMLAEANDQLLERISINLDEADGIKKDANPLLLEVSQHGLTRISGSWNKNMGSSSHGDDNTNSSTGQNQSVQIKLLAGKHVARPQMNFRDRIDNSSNPFMPQLKDKPHSKKPISILIEYEDDGTEFYSHPYIFEIDHLRLPENQIEKSEDNLSANYKSLPDTEAIYVDNPKSLNDMIENLKMFNAIGVDVEHHGYRSFLGITCLIQISTTEKDYIVDPFPLWSDGHMNKLNEIFANPTIVKILHGGVHDVTWIQRDFSLYLVNMFDTYIAAKTLGFPRGCLSLSFLLQHYCNVKTDKKFQLADWRIRPLTQEMLQYARSDTRYLIKIFHLMKNALIEKGNENKNLLHSVYDQSNDLCKQRYEKPSIRPDSYLVHLRKSNVNFNSRQLYAFKELFHWRNKIAREEDESEMYVLPPHMLLKISSELPREMQGIVACCNPVPPLVKQNLHHLHQIVFKAREQPLKSVPDTLNSSKAGISEISMSCHSSILGILENPLKCPLDLSNMQSHEDQLPDLPVLIKNRNGYDKSSTNTIIQVPFKDKPSLDIFSLENTPSTINSSDQVNIFLSPFQRLQLLKPYLEAMAIKQEGVTVEKRSDQERIQSIKNHFDALTAMTPEEYNSERNKNTENGAGNSSTESEESEVEGSTMLDAYNPDPGKVRALRNEFKEGKQEFKKKRKLQLQKEKKTSKHDQTGNRGFPPVKVEDQEKTLDLENNDENKRARTEKTDMSIDFENADFSQYSCGVKQGKSKQFNPWSEMKNKGKMNQKGKTGFKGRTKSFHYKNTK